MDNPRKYGNPPFSTVVVHGGPGAAGEMEPVARKLSKKRGVLEPLQTADSLEGQVAELAGIPGKEAELPVSLVGYSWGAWLSFIVAARHPEIAGKLILIGSGGFRAEDGEAVPGKRLSRLSRDEQDEYKYLLEKLESGETEDRDKLMSRLGAIVSRTDSYDPLEDKYTMLQEPLKASGDIFRAVWSEAAELRASGRLLELADQIGCPVVAIHGDYDPHPADGVRVPLSERLDNFRFILLDKCGHKPWIERHARDEFYQVLEAELG